MEKFIHGIHHIRRTTQRDLRVGQVWKGNNPGYDRYPLTERLILNIDGQHIEYQRVKQQDIRWTRYASFSAWAQELVHNPSSSI